MQEYRGVKMGAQSLKTKSTANERWERELRRKEWRWSEVEGGGGVVKRKSGELQIRER